MPLKSRPLTEAGVRGETPRAADGSARVNPSDGVYAKARAVVVAWLDGHVHPSDLAHIDPDAAAQLVDTIAWTMQEQIDPLVAALTGLLNEPTIAGTIEALSPAGRDWQFAREVPQYAADCDSVTRAAEQARAALALAERADAGTMEKRKEEAR